jgi:hypothetical protein
LPNIKPQRVLYKQFNKLFYSNNDFMVFKPTPTDIKDKNVAQEG